MSEMAHNWMIGVNYFFFIFLLMQVGYSWNRPIARLGFIFLIAVFYWPVIDHFVNWMN